MEQLVRLGEGRWSRRGVLKGALLALLPWELLVNRRVIAAGTYPETIAALENAYQREVNAHQMYMLYSHKARTDGYDGVAYLFFSLAASELIHSQNFEKVLESLNTHFQATIPSISPLSTKENLITAANDEIDTIDHLYPETLKRIELEGRPDAIAYVTYALESEKQHRDMIEQVKVHSEDLFEKVVAAINGFTSRYFVCQNCGSTLSEIPPGSCPICEKPSSNYRKIERPV